MTTKAAALHLGRFSFALDHTLVMGVVNVTPDSFSDGGLFLDPGAAIEQARVLAAEGAAILDIGGESTRPGAAEVSEDEELRRVLPVIEAIVHELDLPVSVDTRKTSVARRCVAAGAVLVNDVNGLREPGMAEAAAEASAGVAIMHMRGTPETMDREVAYDDLVADVRAFLLEQAHKAEAAGVGTVIIDPGLGFAKTHPQSFALIHHLDRLVDTGFPVLVGPSRKRFIGEATGTPADDRVYGTASAIAIAIANGARIVRVHDVAAGVQAVRVADAIRNA